MPLSPSHKAKTRRNITDAARKLFNLHGFDNVSIDDIMGKAGLTRGGFYAHFKNKSELYAEAVSSIRLMHEESGLIKRCRQNPVAAKEAIATYYLGKKHRDLPGKGCPLPALASDVSRENKTVKEAYTNVFTSLAHALSGNFDGPVDLDKLDQKALVASILCVGGQILSRTVTDPALSDKILTSCLNEIKQQAAV